MKSSNFKQLNLVAVIERADEILEALEKLQMSPPHMRDTVQSLIDHGEAGDDWELASLNLVRLEVMERCMRLEDPQLESAPAGWAGGFSTVTTQPEPPFTARLSPFNDPGRPISKPLEHRKIALERLSEPFRSVLIAQVTREGERSEQDAINFLGNDCDCQDYVQEWMKHCWVKGTHSPYMIDGIFNILAASIP